MLGGWDLQYSTEWLTRFYGEVTLEQRPVGSKEVSHADIWMWDVPCRGSWPVQKPDMFTEQQGGQCGYSQVSKEEERRRRDWRTVQGLVATIKTLAFTLSWESLEGSEERSDMI